MADNTQYSPEVKDKALELAAAIGIRAASRSLGMNAGTIQKWTRHPDYSERWAELRRINAPKWRARAAIPMEELVDEYGATLARAIKIANDQLEEIPVRDLGNFIRSVAAAQGIASDHVAKLRGQPAQVHQHVHSAELLDAAMRKILTDAESTAEEIPPAQLEEGNEAHQR